MKSVMIDIETLSARKDATVISFGVAAFDDAKVLETAGWALDFKHLLPGHVDPSTVKWWSEQSAPARAYSFGGGVQPLDAALGLITFLQRHGGDELWANDPTFDVVIMRNWWDELRKTTRLGDFPSHYRQERSFRTISAEARRLGHSLDHAWKTDFVAHNPVDDAATQARAVILARKLMSGPAI